MESAVSMGEGEGGCKKWRQERDTISKLKNKSVTGMEVQRREYSSLYCSIFARWGVTAPPVWRAEHLVMYRIVKSPCCSPEIILYIYYVSVKTFKKQTVFQIWEKIKTKTEEGILWKLVGSFENPWEGAADGGSCEAGQLRLCYKNNIQGPPLTPPTCGCLPCSCRWPHRPSAVHFRSSPTLAVVPQDSRLSAQPNGRE